MKSKVLIFLLFIVGVACHKATPVIPFTVQLERDIEAIDQYLADRNITAIKDTTGVRYVINQLGTGIKPAVSESCVNVTYSGKLMTDGTVFDSNATGMKTPLAYLIPGWQVVLQKVPQGSKVTMYIPSGYAYGASGSSSIPANANLIFDIELLNVYVFNKTGLYCYDDPLISDEAQNAKDFVIVDQYLSSKGITAQVDPAGVRYVITSLGTGAKPTSANCIKATYTGRLLSDGSAFDQNLVGFKAPLVGLIKGWQSSLALFPKGTKATLYIPSRLAYGPYSPSSKIPANANLIFDIELLDVTNYDATTDSCN
jgi:FKBP-type peptidyl-prolyl cis-trans isomerase FkpA